MSKIYDVAISLVAAAALCGPHAEALPTPRDRRSRFEVADRPGEPDFPPPPEPPEPQDLTPLDRERLARAEAKRNRRGKRPGAPPPLAARLGAPQR